MVVSSRLRNQMWRLSSKNSVLWSFVMGKSSAKAITLNDVACISLPPGARSSSWIVPLIFTEDSMRALQALMKSSSESDDFSAITWIVLLPSRITMKASLPLLLVR